jgi:hypothetical protein
MPLLIAGNLQGSIGSPIAITTSPTHGGTWWKFKDAGKPADVTGYL